MIKQQQRTLQQQTLSTYGFPREHIKEFSKKPQILKFLAENYLELKRSLPSLSHWNFRDIAMRPSVKVVLKTLLFVASDLKTGPLRMSDLQLATIAEKRGVSALETTHRLHKKLAGEPWKLNAEQFTRVVCYVNSGLAALEAVERLLPKLTAHPYSLSREDVVSMAARAGGPALEAVEKLLIELTESPYDLTKVQVVTIASKGGGPALWTVKDLLHKLIREPYSQDKKKVVDLASRQQGKTKLLELKIHLDSLLPPGVRPT